MLEIGFIKENKDLVKKAIKNKKGQDVDLDELLSLYDERKEMRGELDELNRKRNEAAKERDVEKGRELKEEASALESKFKDISHKITEILSKIPNVPSPDTPVGEDESGNQVLKQVGRKPNFDFKPKAHWDLGKDLDIIDSERAAKVSGARFTYLKGDLSLMQYALVDFVFRLLVDAERLKKIADDRDLKIKIGAFVPINPPHMIKPEIFEAMGRLDPKEDKFLIESDNLYLIGSAEHSLGPMHMGETLDETELPLRYFGYTPAYRREAGSYGKDTRGILRQHQFDKIEMEVFSLPENSLEEQNFLVGIQEHIMQALELPYQVVAICTGDMAFPDYRQIDIETWMPGQDKYRETHSADLVTGFQARRLGIKVRRGENKTEYIHMNDATAIALGRTLIAIMENYQEEDGSIRVPKVLQEFVGKERIDKK